MPMNLWLAEPISLAPERRRARRLPVSVPAQSRGPQAEPVPVTVTDLNADGCRIEGAIDLAEGAEIWLGIPGIAPRRARIAWADGGAAGCEFFFPVRDDVVAAVAGRSGH
jgi:hypothetical protein